MICKFYPKVIFVSVHKVGLGQLTYLYWSFQEGFNAESRQFGLSASKELFELRVSHKLM